MTSITPGYYWFFPHEPGVEPHPVEVRKIETSDKLVVDRDKNFSLAAYYIGEGWYEPLDELLADGELVGPMSIPERKLAGSGVPRA